MPSPIVGSSLRMTLLGEFALINDRSVLPIGLAGQRLLAYLALRRGPVRRTQIAEALWLAGTGARAAANLRAAMSRLPRPGGRSLVDTAAGHLTLSPAIDTDLRACTALMQQQDTPGTTDLRGLSDDLLPSWDDEWLVLEREQHRQRRLHALERLSGRLCEDGRYEDAVCAALAAVAGEPLRESAHRCVIRAHLLEGNSAEALRQYELYRRLIRADLGLSPSPALRALVAPLLGRPADDE